MQQGKRRWRPGLGLVLGGALAGTLALSFAGLVALRYLGPEIGFREAAVLLATVIAIATAVLGAMLVRLLLRPIRALEAYAEAEGTAAAPAHFGTKELHATAQRVIAMTEALRDREATVRAFTDHVTHEIKTPVAGIRAAVELLEDGGTLAPEDARLLEQIDSARAQIERQLAALRHAAQAREVRYLGEARLADLAPALAAEHPALRIELTGAEVILPMAAEGIALVLGQLMRNALEHGANQIELAAHSTPEATELRVADNGKGISAGNAARVFDPFFTTRRETGGTGMGLSVVRNILSAHRGEIGLLCGGEGGGADASAQEHSQKPGAAFLIRWPKD